ncbi:MAG: hypothetical protein Q7K42_03730, partial [Candidatus Diapherotrites archaeon]|nr:hypothetical protein [Candidatus Diapherotrites archaeon]
MPKPKKNRKPENRPKPKLVQENISRRQFLSTIFRPLDRIPNPDKKIWRTRITRRQLVKGAAIAGTGLFVAHKLGATSAIKRAIPVWFKMHKPYEVEFGFTSHDFVGNKGFVKVMNEATEQGKPFNWIFFESSFTDNETRLSLEAELNQNLEKIKNRYEKEVKTLGKENAELRAKSQIRKSTIQSNNDMTDIYFTAMIHGTRVKILEFHDADRLRQIQE